jgi:protein-S-isoprenylcysteine O-methyltransferase Ste14
MPSLSPPASPSSTSSPAEAHDDILRDRTIRGLVALWFLLVAGVAARGVAAVLAGPLDQLALARLLARALLFSFVLMIAVLTIARAPAIARARGVLPFLAAFFGTNLVFLGVLLLRPREDLPEAVLFVSTLLIAAGNGLAVISLRHLGRSFSILAEARSLVRSGPYRWVRHPLYAAEFLAVLGVLVQYASIEAAILVLAQCACQLLRMRNEESLLAGVFPDYAAYRRQTARLVPGVW